jgi:PPP family 3-phenylpropionic acid transporter
LSWSPRKALAAIYVGQFFFLGIQLPFFPGWLESRGFTPAAIGAIVGAALVLRLVVAPFLAYRAESLADPRWALRLASLSLFILGGLLLAMPSNPVVAAATVGLLFTFGLIVPLTDATVLRADRRGDVTYGRMRGIGSMAFILANLAGGFIISRSGDDAAITLMAFAGLLTLAASLLLPREPRVKDDGVRRLPSLAEAGRLFRSPSFLFMLFGAGLIQGSHAVYYNFAELHWSALGYSSLLIGVLWTTGVVAEIGLLFWARQIFGRFSPASLIAIGGASAGVRWLLTGLSVPLPILFGLQILHALTFAATYLGTIEFVARAVPDQYRTTAMTLVSTLGVGALTGLGAVATGFVFDPQAPFAAYAVTSGMGLGGLILALFLRRRWDGGLLKSVPGQSGRCSARG